MRRQMRLQLFTLKLNKFLYVQNLIETQLNPDQLDTQKRTVFYLIWTRKHEFAEE
jgi:hypothetical protein